MSDFDSDEDAAELTASSSGSARQSLSSGPIEDDRRAHHNKLERKRRDHIKDSFTMLREVVPNLKGEKASRALILKKAAEYICQLNENIDAQKKDMEEIRRQNAFLEKNAFLDNRCNGQPLVSQQQCQEQTLNLFSSQACPTYATTQLIPTSINTNDTRPCFAVSSNEYQQQNQTESNFTYLMNQDEHMPQGITIYPGFGTSDNVRL